MIVMIMDSVHHQILKELKSLVKELKALRKDLKK